MSLLELILRVHRQPCRRRLLEKLARRFVSVKRAKVLAARIP